MPSKGLKGRIKAALELPETLPSMRRYFVNTVFDATFAMLGVIIGSAFALEPQRDFIITTLVTSAIALSISTGTSVYEAESLEQSRRMDEIGRAMLTSVEDSDIGTSARTSSMLIALINSIAPILAGIICVTPFLLFSTSDIVAAAETSIGLALSMLFVTGFMMGRSGGKNPWYKGARMTLIGLAAFAICYMIGGAI